jgi:hypothetical protein
MARGFLGGRGCPGLARPGGRGGAQGLAKLLLRECDDAGRAPGAPVGTVDEALDYLRELERSNNGGPAPTGGAG